MTDKITCTVTGNWSYISGERLKKGASEAGSEKKFRAGYVSKEGRKLRDEQAQMWFPSANETPTTYKCLNDEQRAFIDEKIDAIRPTLRFKNKIRCQVTGELLFISDERKASLLEKARESNANMTMEMVEDSYISRVAKNLRTEKARKLLKSDEKGFGDLTPAQQKEVDAEIRLMADQGKLPAASSPKGSKKRPEPAPPAKPVSKPVIQETHSKVGSSKSTAPADTGVSGPAPKQTEKAPAKTKS